MRVYGPWLVVQQQKDPGMKYFAGYIIQVAAFSILDDVHVTGGNHAG